MELIVQLCEHKGSLNFPNTSNRTEIGYVAHLTRIATLLQQIADKNDLIKEQFEENQDWSDFVLTYLKPRLELRTGSLCRGK